MDEPVSFRRHQLVWLATRLRGEARRADEFSSLAVEGLMLEMVAGVARESARISDDEHPRWLRRAREILHDNFAERMSLSVIAETVGVHPVYLATAFRRRFGCSVGEYVRRLRVEFASREISGTDAPLADIALSAGFSHQAHFSRTFKRLTGLTPARYRSISRAS
jgi:AraC family transcriptional regulator